MNNYTTVSGGTSITLVTNRDAVIDRIFWGGTYVGTLAVYDSATAAGTSTTNLITTIPLPGANFPYSLEINARVRNGIVYEATGTPVMNIVWR